MTPEQEEVLRQLLLTIVPADGTPVGNVTARRLFLQRAAEIVPDLDESAYWLIRNRLLESGLLELGKGKGGSVSRLLLIPDEPEPEEEEEEFDRRPPRRERDLYAPFRTSLEDYWVYEHDLHNYITQVTAHQGRRRTGGRWTRPDVVLVSVEQLPFIPGAILEVASFEIKPLDTLDVQGIFEAAAHSVFAHKSYVAVQVSEEFDDDYVIDRFVAECRRFNIGLILFEQADNPDMWNILYEPTRREPDPRAVSDFITTQISAENKDRLRGFLGQ